MITGDLPQVGGSEGRPFCYLGRRLACSQCVKDGPEVIGARTVTGLVGRPPASPGQRDSFQIIVHEQENIADQLRCHCPCDNVSGMRNQSPQSDTGTCQYCGKGIRRNAAGIWGARKRDDSAPWYCGASPAADKNHEPEGASR